MKKLNLMYNTGKCKYIVNYSNGIDTNKDGSIFYNIAIFKNVKKRNKFIKTLKSDLYEETGI